MAHHPTGNTLDGPLCQTCARPVADHARLCAVCTDALCYDLRAVAGVMDDLIITRSKQDAIAEKHARVSGTRDRPLGYRPAASEAADVLRMTLAYWARVIAHARHTPTPGGTAVDLAMWLARHRETIRQHDGAGDLVGQIRYAIGNARQVVDRPPERIYAGLCSCRADLYAREGAQQVKCTECGIVYSVQDRRREMLDQIRDHLATASEIASGIGELHGQTINRKTINKWNSRDRLLVRGYSAQGHPLFKIGDVLDLAVAGTRKHTTPDIASA